MRTNPILTYLLFAPWHYCSATGFATSRHLGRPSHGTSTATGGDPDEGRSIHASGSEIGVEVLLVEMMVQDDSSSVVGVANESGELEVTFDVTVAVLIGN